MNVHAVPPSALDVELVSRADGALLMRCLEPLAPYDTCVGAWIDRWAAQKPDHPFLIEQTAAGERSITYGQTRQAILEIAEHLLDYNLSADRPLAILASNSIDHALAKLAAMYIGAAVAEIAPAYAIQAKEYSKLANCFQLLTPGLIVVEDGQTFRPAIESVVGDTIPVAALRNAEALPGARDFASLRAGKGRGAEVLAAARMVGPDTVAKYLFTSGSTGMPKAVINTHRMLCVSQQMQKQVAPYVADPSPVMIDWLVWNHTAGGNSNFGIVLSNGGTMYIDPGKPTPALIGASVELLRRVSPTIYFNVPLGFEALLPYLDAEPALRKSLFGNLQFLWYAAAALQPSTWDALQRLAVQTIGKEVLILSGLGMTETAPVALFGNVRATGVGIVGIPAPGLELKLVPHDGFYEARYRGPNVTPGYLRDPEATRSAFDEEGFFKSGDLVSFVNPDRPDAGLRFEGRASEDFKLKSGTRVSAGALRLKALDALFKLAKDVLIVGADRDDVRMLVFPDVPDLKDVPAALREEIRARVARLREEGTGSSNRIVAALLVDEAPMPQTGELTEKGTINSRAFQRNRPELIKALYDPTNQDVLR